MKGDKSSFGRFRAGSVEIVIDDVAAIAKEAGDAIMKIYEDPETIKAWSEVAASKDDGSPLTAADTAANAVICSRLGSMYPTIPIVSEENAAIPFAERSSWEYFWCVDPLDGTKEFVKRNGQFTVNIGLCHKQEPIAGVVYVPATAVMYKGVKGLGPPVRETDDPLGYDSYRSIFCAEFDEADPGLKVVASQSHNTPETEEFIMRYQDPVVKSYGSSLKLLMVAQGEAHVYPRMAPTMEWDTCAAQAIVECAGGQVLQLGEKGGPLVYNKPDPHNPFFVVYGKRRKKILNNRDKRDVDLSRRRHSRRAAGEKISDIYKLVALLLLLCPVAAALLYHYFFFN